METLTVTFLQAELHWHDAAANREHLARRMDDLATPTDLVVLPEMFSTGFSMDAPALAEAAAHALPAGIGPAAEWIVTAAASGIVGLVVGAVLIPVVEHLLAPAFRRLRRAVTGAPEAGDGGGAHRLS